MTTRTCRLIGAETVCAAVHLMTQLYGMAMKETPPIVTGEPVRRARAARDPAARDRLPRARRGRGAVRCGGGDRGALADPDRARARRSGLRPGELYGLHGHRVDWLRGKIQVIDVMTRTGLRQWPKSKKSHRIVPVPPHILEGMSALMAGRPRDALVFTAPEGGPVDDGNFRDRIWYPAVEAAGIRRFPPRIMRHTAASWLVIDGVPLYDVQALLGHESYRTTERYAHLAPDAHDKVVQSWARRHQAADVTSGRSIDSRPRW